MLGHAMIPAHDRTQCTITNSNRHWHTGRYLEMNVGNS